MSDQKSLARLLTNRVSIVRDASERLRNSVREVLRDENRGGEDIAMLRQSCGSIMQELQKLAFDLGFVAVARVQGEDEVPTTSPVPMKLEA